MSVRTLVRPTRMSNRPAAMHASAFTTSTSRDPPLNDMPLGQCLSPWRRIVAPQLSVLAGQAHGTETISSAGRAPGERLSSVDCRGDISFHDVYRCAHRNGSGTSPDAITQCLCAWRRGEGRRSCELDSRHAAPTRQTRAVPGGGDPLAPPRNTRSQTRRLCALAQAAASAAPGWLGITKAGRGRRSCACDQFLCPRAPPIQFHPQNDPLIGDAATHVGRAKRGSRYTGWILSRVFE